MMVSNTMCYLASTVFRCMADAQWTDYAHYAKKRNLGHKGMAVVIAAGGIWSRSRLHECKAVASPICPRCNEEHETDVHRHWACKANVLAEVAKASGQERAAVIKMFKGRISIDLCRTQHRALRRRRGRNEASEAQHATSVSERACVEADLQTPPDD